MIPVFALYNVGDSWTNKKKLKNITKLGNGLLLLSDQISPLVNQLFWLGLFRQWRHKQQMYRFNKKTNFGPTKNLNSFKLCFCMVIEDWSLETKLFLRAREIDTSRVNWRFRHEKRMYVAVQMSSLNVTQWFFFHTY